MTKLFSTPEPTPEVTPKMGDFPPKMVVAENCGGEPIPPKIEPENFGGNFGETAEIRHFLVAGGGAMRSRARADYPFGIIITSGSGFGADEVPPPKSPRSLGLSLRFAPTSGFGGHLRGVEGRAHG